MPYRVLIALRIDGIVKLFRTSFRLSRDKGIYRTKKV